MRLVQLRSNIVTERDVDTQEVAAHQMFGPEAGGPASNERAYVELETDWGAGGPRKGGIKRRPTLSQLKRWLWARGKRDAIRGLLGRD